ncbi:hypothetical protein [Candidatus Solincola sp.]|nr:hypothetical protein [Actinomycetota bacterium]MDI7251656.1 hypothetical protein [Actinomycetota bacterium]
MDTMAIFRFFTPERELEPLEVPPEGETRTTVYLNDLLGLESGREVSTEVKVEGSGIVAVERAMYFVYTSPETGKVMSGGTCSIGFGE